MKSKISLRLLAIGLIAVATGFQCALAVPPKSKSSANGAGNADEAGDANGAGLPAPDFVGVPREAQDVYIQYFSIPPENFQRVKRELKKIDAELDPTPDGTYDVLGPKRLNRI